VVFGGRWDNSQFAGGDCRFVVLVFGLKEIYCGGSYFNQQSFIEESGEN